MTPNIPHPALNYTNLVETFPLSTYLCVNIHGLIYVTAPVYTEENPSKRLSRILLYITALYQHQTGQL
jgi:hypothetical protein